MRCLRPTLLARPVLLALLACWFAVLAPAAWAQPAAPLRAPSAPALTPQSTAAQTPRPVPPLSSRISTVPTVHSTSPQGGAKCLLSPSR